MQSQYLALIFHQFSDDQRITSWHISIYMSVFYLWSVNGFKNPVQVSRKKVMQLAHVYSKMTYHKCIRELHQFGYISYLPSYNPFLGSTVHMLFPGNEH